MDLSAVAIEVFETMIVLVADLTRFARRAGASLRIKPSDHRIVVVCAGAIGVSSN